ncbi:hypothetical protein JHK84_035172 [Glycine max]|uniref:Uncharacterized protein n=2 Tax=Glycine subgen. Soja TaxID=1462606 RepID=K7LWP0_SOYBN|nr:hypothetical protein JHK85_035553 [Glycine max]KAG4987219.1 hypothetical protein JHK86_034910 [Glycine max]KAG5141404.1 hypothetical protein JHK84_035172 [Glycine max]RZB77423.1 Inositol-phosphate phosphatase [Glycine soja]
MTRVRGSLFLEAGVKRSNTLNLNTFHIGNTQYTENCNKIQDLTKDFQLKAQVDLVTETDKACEELIFNHLKQLYPTHKVDSYLLQTEQANTACLHYLPCNPLIDGFQHSKGNAQELNWATVPTFSSNST